MKVWHVVLAVGLAVPVVGGGVWMMARKRASSGNATAAVVPAAREVAPRVLKTPQAVQMGNLAGAQTALMTTAVVKNAATKAQQVDKAIKEQQQGIQNQVKAAQQAQQQASIQTQQVIGQTQKLLAARWG